MWIATEINLHHDNTIKEAFNRQLAAKRRKIFWDLNPEHPKAPIYTDYIDLYAKRAAAGKLLGGYNYEHFNIFQNVNIPPGRLDEIISQYEPGSIWYTRDIEGKRSIADGLIYVKLATAIASGFDKQYEIEKGKVQNLINSGSIRQINIGVDFGGNGSGHAFVATAITTDYKYLIVLRSERYAEGKPELGNDEVMSDIDPKVLGDLFVRFVKRVQNDYGFISRIYADSAEQVLIRGLRSALNRAGMGNIKISNALKTKINDRIFATTSLSATGRVLYIPSDCRSWEEAISMAIWNKKKIELERLDNGTSDIDTLDAYEYTFEKDIKKLVKELAGR